MAALAREEQNHGQALILLDKAQALGGDEEFWFQLSLTKVRAVVGQRLNGAQAKVSHFYLTTIYSTNTLSSFP